MNHIVYSSDSCSSNAPLESQDRMTESFHAELEKLRHERGNGRGGNAIPFPHRLHNLLDLMDARAAKGDATGKSIVGWQPHGRAFRVHQKDVFVSKILPAFFSQTKYASFQRQLNMYGFVRITHGSDKGAVYHPLFVRHQRDLIPQIVRMRIKGTKTRKAIPLKDQPDFYARHELRVIAAVDAAFDESSAPSPKETLVTNIFYPIRTGSNELPVVVDRKMSQMNSTGTYKQLESTGALKQRPDLTLSDNTCPSVVSDGNSCVSKASCWSFPNGKPLMAPPSFHADIKGVRLMTVRYMNPKFTSRHYSQSSVLSPSI